MPTLQLLQTEPKIIRIPLGVLIPLEHTDIPGGSLAMRPLDEHHIQSLIDSDSATWPPILTTKTSIGYILIDGYHRQEAATRKGETSLAAHVQSYATTQDIIEAAFRANLSHGLKSSEETRGDYAFWLHVTYPHLTQIEIAKRACISQPAVSKAITKREAALREEARAGEKKQQDMEQACKHFSKMVLRFTETITGVADEELLSYIQTAVKKPEERSKLARAGQLLLHLSGRK